MYFPINADSGAVVRQLLEEGEHSTNVKIPSDDEYDEVFDANVIQISQRLAQCSKEGIKD